MLRWTHCCILGLLIYFNRAAATDGNFYFLSFLGPVSIYLPQIAEFGRLARLGPKSVGAIGPAEPNRISTFLAQPGPIASARFGPSRANRISVLGGLPIASAFWGALAGAGIAKSDLLTGRLPPTIFSGKSFES